MQVYYQHLCTYVCYRNRLDELRAFLENEAWEICPVRSSFTIQSLRVSYLATYCVNVMIVYSMTS